MAAAGTVPAVVSPQWLAERLGQPDIKVVDASWYLPPMGEQPLAWLVMIGHACSSRPSIVALLHKLAASSHALTPLFQAGGSCKMCHACFGPYQISCTHVLADGSWQQLNGCYATTSHFCPEQIKATHATLPIALSSPRYQHPASSSSSHNDTQTHTQADTCRDAEHASARVHARPEGHAHTHRPFCPRSPINLTGRDRFSEHKAERIPGARFWDIDGVCDLSTDLPHMLPSEEVFAAAADALGIGNDDTVVIYDGMGLFSSPRAWWTWKVSKGTPGKGMGKGKLPLFPLPLPLPLILTPSPTPTLKGYKG